MIDVDVYAQLTPTIYAQVREVLFTIWEAHPNPTRLRQAFWVTEKIAKIRKAPISMIHADVYAQLTPTLYAQVREVLIYHLRSPPKPYQAPPGIRV